MNSRLMFWIILLGIIVLLDYYLFQSIKVLTKNRNLAMGAVILDVAITIALIFMATNLERNEADRDSFQVLSAFFFLVFVPKFVLIIPMMLEDIVRIFRYLFSLTQDESYMPSRRKAISTLAWGLAGLSFMGVLYGIVRGKFNYKVRRVPIKLPNLPDSFKGFKIVQISDIHSGSFHTSAIPQIEKGIRLINEQNADLVLFTGDLVNLKADEIIPFKDTFAQIKAKQGKYSVLGNHDYGTYFYGKNEAKNRENRNEVGKHLADMGFTQLRNEHVKITKGEEFINLIGVENFGADFRFPKTGDLSKATEGLENGTTNILMSHDPTHFDHTLPEYTNIIDFEIPMHLTLAGHTHGAQIGIDIPGFIKFSPVQFVYKKWAGLYEEKGKYLYVNEGFGYLGFPGRVGIWPEITVFELQSED